VQPADFAADTGSGFLFDEYHPAALTAILRVALERYAAAAPWERLMQRGMALDYSWQRQVHTYVDLYERLIAG
jgi:starch synthase